jgi:hypothetical protein
MENAAVVTHFNQIKAADPAWKNGKGQQAHPGSATPFLPVSEPPFAPNAHQPRKAIS